MEKVNIPRFAKWSSEFNVFRDVNKFTELAEKLCVGRNRNSPVAVLKELSYLPRQPVDEIQTIFDALIEAAFNSRRPDYPPLRDCQPLFPDGAVKRWRREKSKLKQAIQSHAFALELVKLAQEKCWASRSKVKQYCSMLDAARISLQYNKGDPNEAQARGNAIKGLKKDLLKRQKAHMKNVGVYEARMLDELKIRLEIKKLVDELRNDISRHIHANLAEGVCNMESATDTQRFTIDLDISEMSHGLYDVTCRKYVFTPPPPNVISGDFNTPVCTPHLELTSFQDNGTNPTYASDNRLVTTTLRVDALTCHDLYLRPGDIIKQKMVSRDGRRSFGWAKSSKFSFKRWGFFKSSAVRPVATITTTSTDH